MDSNPFARIEAAEAVENPHARFAAEGVTAGPEADTETGKPVETEVPEPEPDPFPKGTRVRVAIAGQISRKKYKLGTVEERGGSSQWRVLIDGEPSLGVYTCGQLSLLEAEPAAPVALELPAEAPRAKPERKPRAAPSGDRKPSKSAELDAAAARGEMPTKPVMTSKSNPHYQARFDKLEALAQAGDWDAVRGYRPAQGRHPYGCARFWRMGSAARSTSARPYPPATAFDFQPRLARGRARREGGEVFWRMG